MGGPAEIAFQGKCFPGTPRLLFRRLLHCLDGILIAIYSGVKCLMSYIRVGGEVDGFSCWVDSTGCAGALPCKVVWAIQEESGYEERSNAGRAFMAWDFVRRGIEAVDARFRYVKKSEFSN